MGLPSCCPYCLGIIGRDCFNVEECGEITRGLARSALEHPAGIEVTLSAEMIIGALRFDAGRYLVTRLPDPAVPHYRGEPAEDPIPF